MEAFFESARHIISTILAIIMMPISFLMSPAESYEAKNPDELITSFTVLSDIHIEGNKFPTFEKYEGILKDIRDSKDTDTLVFLGDNTMNGQDIESIFFYTPLRLTKPAENLIFAPGNHDYGNGNGGYDKFADRFLRYANFAGCDIDNTYYYKVIDGYYFIVLSSESDSVNASDISDAQLEWLNGVLAEASKDDKPIFVFSHYPVNYIENGASDRLSNVIDDYEDVIFFCGHTHWNLSPYTVSTTNGVRQVNVPRSTDIFEDGSPSCVGAVVEVYENEVLLRFRDFNTFEWVEEYEYSFEI